MKDLCLGYHDENTWNGQSAKDRDALMEATFAYADELRSKGHVLYEQALQSARTGATLRFDSGKVSVTDGPFAETKEQMGGIMVLEADDLNEAIRLMSKMPCMRMGGAIEIRPINEEIRETVNATSAVPAHS